MRIHFKTASHECEGELVVPSSASSKGKLPGVVLIQEWWGVDDHICDVAARLAKEGFRVLAPDLFHGKVVARSDSAEAGHMMQGLDWKRALEEIAGAVEHLRTHETSNGKVGVMGFCMGGALSFAAACNISGLSAVVPFYGVPDKKLADYSKVTAPILAHFAKRDGWAKVEHAEAIKQALTAAGKPMWLETYDADHAFFNDKRSEVYDEASASLAWERTLAFLKEHLA
jgi:carboxymethylenebutenolidase